jgi:myo-inositol-1(or 4)-monophosphatase
MTDVAVDDDALLAIARAAAAKGAEVLDRAFVHRRGVRPEVETKGSAIDLVTAVDRESERVVVDALKSTGIPVVAEEGGGTPAPTTTGPGSEVSPTGLRWYVDPLDGTTNFAMGHPFHCVAIGLVDGAGPRLGVVYAPQLHLVWSGTTRAATRRDLARGEERPLAVSTFDTIDAVLVGTGFPYDRRTSSDDNLAPHNALMKRAQGVMRCGSAAIDLCLVAEGTYGAFWERKLKPWDLCAGAAFVLAAGGRVSDPWGRPFRVEEGAVLASNGRLHDSMIGALEPHLPAPTPRP